MLGPMADRIFGIELGPSSTRRYTYDEMRAMIAGVDYSGSPSGGSPSSDSKKEKGKSFGEKVKAVGKAISPKKLGKK